MNRNRILYLLLIGITVVAGLASRRYPEILPQWVHYYAGDTLWAFMVFLGIACIFKRKSTLWVAATTLLFSYLIEISQLYHAPWIDALREYRLGGLILGFGFLWSDLLCYTLGAGLGILLEKGFEKRKWI